MAREQIYEIMRKKYRKIKEKMNGQKDNVGYMQIFSDFLKSQKKKNIINK